MKRVFLSSFSRLHSQRRRPPPARGSLPFLPRGAPAVQARPPVPTGALSACQQLPHLRALRVTRPRLPVPSGQGSPLEYPVTPQPFPGLKKAAATVVKRLATTIFVTYRLVCVMESPFFFLW